MTRTVLALAAIAVCLLAAAPAASAELTAGAANAVGHTAQTSMR